MKIITEEEYYELLEDWFNNKNIGRNTYILILEKNELYIGIDNSTNDFFTEEFKSLVDTKKYLGIID